MDLSNSTVKTPDAETETTTRIQPAKAPNFSNGVLKRHAALHLHHPVVVTYKECLKNHAASLGGHAVDGCGEFMPSPTSNPADPTSLKCAACGCHRNFHRREHEDPLLPTPANAAPTLEYRPHHRHHPPTSPPARANSGGSSPNNSPSPPPISSSYYTSAPQMLLALSHGGFSVPRLDSKTPISAVIHSSSNSRKRFRTKFTQNQKERMLQFAERVGWKMQKSDDDVISEFCNEIGVDKVVFKVWMHNNKNNSAKKVDTSTSPPSAATTNGGTIRYSDIGAAAEEDHHQHHQNSEDSKENLHEHELSHHHLHEGSILGANGSSSS